MGLHRCPIAPLIALTLWAAPRAGRAADDLAAADALFQRGLAAFEAGQYDRACPALKESFQLAPRAGVLFTLAECNNSAGSSATALARYREYLRMVDRMPSKEAALQSKRVGIAKREAARLEPLVPKLTLTPAAGTPDTMTVTLDGQPLGAGAVNVPLPVDPGRHAISTQAPGTPPKEIVISLAPGESKSVPLTVPVPLPAPEVPRRTRRTAALVFGGVGVGGLAVGGVFGALAWSKVGAIHDGCPTPTSCTPASKQDADSAKTLGNVSTVGFAVAGGALAIATVLWLTTPKAEHPPLPASPESARVDLFRW